MTSHTIVASSPRALRRGACSSPPGAQTQPRPIGRALFDTTDVMIPMRDGVKLHTTILLVPKGLNTATCRSF